jgi:hypothetical protein
MFVESVAEIAAPLPGVEKRLQDLISRTNAADGVIYHKDGEIRAKVGPKGITRQVALEVWSPEVHWYGVVYPLRWKALGATKLFPELNADLVLSKDGPDRTTLTLRGIYDPPLGSVGRMADRALLGRVAEATVADWMDRLAAALSPQDAER